MKKRITVLSTRQEALKFFLGQDLQEFAVEVHSDPKSFLVQPESTVPDFLFLELNLIRPLNNHSLPTVAEYKEDLQAFRKALPTSKIILLTENRTMRACYHAVLAGADNYLPYPLLLEELKIVLETEAEVLKKEQEITFLKSLVRKSPLSPIVETKSPLMADALEKLDAVAPTRSTVLLTGESGTGKGVMARLIHQKGDRSTGPFVSVHCGAIPEGLVESELFGHEKGAFTGAVKRKLGKFELANRGTIFLDEIGTISQQAQIKLLKVLQERNFQRVGGEDDIEVDVRIIAATNMNLRNLVEEGKFREDLYYRLNVFPIELPPLRDRIEDIPLLVNAFLERYNNDHGRSFREASPSVLEALKTYPWPGNIRELENILERACVLERSDVLTPQVFPREIFDHSGPAPLVKIGAHLSLAEARNRAIEAVERAYLKELLEQNNGRADRSADMAGITTRQLHKLLTKHGIDRKSFVH